MKKYIILFGIIAVSGTFNFLNAQSSSSISKSLGLYVFPSKDQDAKTQDADETACYKWAIDQTGYDPMNPTKVTAAQVDTSPKGGAVVGAGLGAAGGAAIGAIAGNAGEGAAIGAILGGIRGRRAMKEGEQQQQQANNQAASAKTKQMATDYNNAFTACMEGKGYTVK